MARDTDAHLEQMVDIVLEKLGETGIHGELNQEQFDKLVEAVASKAEEEGLYVSGY